MLMILYENQIYKAIPKTLTDVVKTCQSNNRKKRSSIIYKHIMMDTPVAFRDVDDSSNPSDNLKGSAIGAFLSGAVVATLFIVLKKTAVKSYKFIK